MSELTDKIEAQAAEYLRDFLDFGEVSPKQESTMLLAGILLELAEIRSAIRDDEAAR